MHLNILAEQLYKGVCVGGERQFERQNVISKSCLEFQTTPGSTFSISFQFRFVHRRAYHTPKSISHLESQLHTCRLLFRGKIIPDFQPL